MKIQHQVAIKDWKASVGFNLHKGNLYSIIGDE